MSKLFGPVRQVGYVVKDIEKAMVEWGRLGVGPWFYKAEVVSTEFRYQGQPSRLPQLSIALANSGELQIELIQQRDSAMIEISELTGGKGEYFDTIRQACTAWDGTEPIRRL